MMLLQPLPLLLLLVFSISVLTILFLSMLLWSMLQLLLPLSLFSVAVDNVAAAVVGAVDSLVNDVVVVAASTVSVAVDNDDVVDAVAAAVVSACFLSGARLTPAPKLFRRVLRASIDLSHYNVSGSLTNPLSAE